jgi:hypothetical protein
VKRSCVAVGVLIASLAQAHPGNGIVALPDGRILTGDAVGNGVWLFQAGSSPRLILADFHCHWLTRGLDGRLYAEVQSHSAGRWISTLYRVDAAGSSPVQLRQGTLSESIFTADRDGSLVQAHEGRLTVRDTNGKTSPFRGDGTALAGEPPLGQVSALVWGPREVLYLCDGAYVRKVGRDGRIRLIKRFEGRATLEQFGGAGGTPRVWGLAVDSEENVYAALASHGRTVRFAVGAQEHTVASADDGWVATGVAASDRAVFLLETKLEGTRNLGPRVRRIDSSGSTVLGTARSR